MRITKVNVTSPETTKTGLWMSSPKGPMLGVMFVLADLVIGVR